MFIVLLLFIVVVVIVVGDVLFVTSARISRQNFIMWERLFIWLGLTVDYWDTERYNGLSMDLTYLQRHDVSLSPANQGKADRVVLIWTYRKHAL